VAGEKKNGESNRLNGWQKERPKKVLSCLCSGLVSTWCFFLPDKEKKPVVGGGRCGDEKGKKNERKGICAKKNASKGKRERGVKKS